MKKRTYSELSRFKTLEERFDYLKLTGQVGVDTFGFDRYMNQVFYKSDIWRKVRREVIIRDNGCDLGVTGYEIQGTIIVHHMNALTEEDILERNPDIFNIEYLICSSLRTHNALHFGDKDLLPQEFKERRRGDTCPWKVY